MMRERTVLFSSLSPRRGSGGVRLGLVGSHGDGVENPPWARHDPCHDVWHPPTWRSLRISQRASALFSL